MVDSLATDIAIGSPQLEESNFTPFIVPHRGVEVTDVFLVRRPSLFAFSPALRATDNR